MNKTRKEIISLISDYIEKDLADGYLNAIFTYIFKKINKYKRINSNSYYKYLIAYNKIYFANTIYNDEVFKIPNKPLSLYNEDEEKELLDLLLKL